MGQEIEKIRMEFWKDLIALCRKRENEFADHVAVGRNWIKTPSGVPGTTYSFVINLKQTSVVLSVEGSEDERIRLLYSKLEAQKTQIERDFGRTLDWSEKPGRRARRIISLVSEHGIEERAHWPELQAQLVDAMESLIRVMQPRIDAVKPTLG